MAAAPGSVNFAVCPGAQVQEEVGRGQLAALAPHTSSQPPNLPACMHAVLPHQGAIHPSCLHGPISHSPPVYMAPAAAKASHMHAKHA